MNFEAAQLAGVFLIELEPHLDERGSFTRLFDAAEFSKRGLCDKFPEHSLAENTRRGTLRGIHYQSAPHEETKLIRVTRGAVFDVLVDLRPASPTYGKWQGFELRVERPTQLYVPTGIAHGYQALLDGSEVHYLISTEFAPDAARGIHYNSAQLAIPWPLPVSAISERDRAFPEFDARR